MKDMKRKFGISGILLVLIVLLGMLIQYLYLGQSMIKDKHLILTQSQENLAGHIRNDIKHSSETISLLGEFISINQWSEGELLEFFQRAKRNNPIVNNIYFQQNNNKLVTTSEEEILLPYNLDRINWNMDGLKEKPVLFSPVYLDPLSGLPLVTLSKGIVDEGGSYLGSLAMDLNLDKIVEIVIETKVKLTGYSFLIDNSGNILAHPKYSYLSEEEIINLASFSPEVYGELRDSKEGQIETEIAGIWGCLTYGRIDDTGWLIGNFVSNKELRNNYLDVWRILFITIIISCLIFIILAHLQKMHFVRPIERLD